MPIACPFLIMHHNDSAHCKGATQHIQHHQIEQMLCNAVALYQIGLSFCLLLLLKNLGPAQLHASLMQHLLGTHGMMDLTQLTKNRSYRYHGATITQQPTESKTSPAKRTTHICKMTSFHTHESVPGALLKQSEHLAQLNVTVVTL